MPHWQTVLVNITSSIAKFIIAYSMLCISVNNEHHMLDFYHLDFTNELPARKLRTQTLPENCQLDVTSSELRKLFI